MDGREISHISPLKGDASTRKYYRVALKDHGAMILALYPEGGLQDQRNFRDVAQLLRDLNLPAPLVYSHHEGLGITLMEDLGDISLEARARESQADQLRNLYEEAVDILIRMRRGTEGLSGGCAAFDLAFDHTKLMWEMDFFVTHFVRGFAGHSLSKGEHALLYQFFDKICSLLAAQPRFFTHRDYHSRNLMLHNNRLIMIDFQDARMGPAQYDMASLLKDSYITLENSLIEDLLGHYFQESGHGRICDYESFRRIFHIMSLQRNIKALGTFGFQLSARGNERYRESMPRTAGYIIANIGKFPEFSQYEPIITDHVTGPALGA
jgi:hypothetical protein